MSYTGYEDIWMFLDVNERRIFRMWRYKTYWNPYEEKNCSEFDSCYMDDECSYIIIREVIPLPGNDFLLGVEYINNEDIVDNAPDYVEYVRFSEIDLAYAKSDQFNSEE